MAKVTIVFTEEEVRKMKALEGDTDETGVTVELCGEEPAFLEVGVIEDYDFPNEVDLFVTTMGDSGAWEKHWITGINKDELVAGVPYHIFTGISGEA